MKFSAPTDANVVQIAKRRSAEEVAINKELYEFRSDPELMLDKHQRWYLNMIACDAPRTHQRQLARKMLDESLWLFSSKCLDLPPTRQGEEKSVVEITIGHERT